MVRIQSQIVLMTLRFVYAQELPELIEISLSKILSFLINSSGENRVILNQYLEFGDV